MAAMKRLPLPRYRLLEGAAGTSTTTDATGNEKEGGFVFTYFKLELYHYQFGDLLPIRMSLTILLNVGLFL